MTVQIKQVPSPQLDHHPVRPVLTDETMAIRKQKVIDRMKEFGFSSLVIYADKEHGSQFEYLVGFIPRFEEGLLLLNQDGTSSLLLGNENINKVKHARIDSQGIHCPFFSLPNQPMDFTQSLLSYLQQAHLDSSKKVGLVGWKLLAKDGLDFVQKFDVPYFIVDSLKELVGSEKLYNGTGLLIDPSQGARVTNTANEIATYEYGASLASDGVLKAMNHLSVGVSELETGDLLNQDGQYPTVVTISAFGERFVKGNIYPTERTLQLGDKIALTAAYKGGLSSRSGYGVHNKEQLEQVDPGYLDQVVVPYYEAYLYWLDQIKIGMNAGEFYQQFDTFYPQSVYGWELCPGHLTADEEWLCSPFYAGSDKTIKSGMIFQLDFIPVQPNHHGVSAESTLALADKQLREEIQTQYPELWQRIENRRSYLKQVLNISLSEEILPLCSTLGYLRPFMLNKQVALTKK